MRRLVALLLTFMLVFQGAVPAVTAMALMDSDFTVSDFVDTGSIDADVGGDDVTGGHGDDHSDSSDVGSDDNMTHEDGHDVGTGDGEQDAGHDTGHGSDDGDYNAGDDGDYNASGGNEEDNYLEGEYPGEKPEDEEFPIDEEYEYKEEEEEEEEIIAIAALSMFTPLGLPVEATHIVNTEAGLRAALGATTNPTVIRLTSDFPMTGAVMTMGGTAARVVHIYSDSPTAFTVNRTADAGGTDNNRRHITSSGVLHLHNVHLTSVTPAGATAVRGGIRVTGGHLHLRDGSIISNNRAETGGGIRIEGGTVTMHGGEIRNNYSHRTSAGNGGGGVLITGGTSFTMAGGLIYGNRARNTGGGVQIAGSGDSGTATFTMTGGTIQNNTAGRNQGSTTTVAATQASGAGGALHLNSGGVARLSGNAELIENQAYVAGGAVRIYGDGTAGMATFTMTGNVNIIGNRAGTNGGGISSRVAGHHINITDWHGEISGNEAGVRGLGNPNVGGNGGGIHIQAGGTGTAGNRLTIGAGSTGEIVNNVADHGGGIFSHLENLPATGAIGGRIVIASGVDFSGNEARMGMRVDEGLGQRNMANFPHEGSLEWMGVIPGTTTVEPRTHLFNNVDINVRQWIYLRQVDFGIDGTAAGSSELTATLTHIAQAGAAGTAITTPAGSSNIGTHNAAAAGTRVAVNVEIPTGTLVPVHATATATSMVEYEVTYRPWTATIGAWNINGGGNTNVGNATLAARNITSVPPNLNADEVIVTIDYRTHPVTFNVYGGGTLEGVTVPHIRQYRESSDTLYSANTDGGSPVGMPPLAVENAGWVFTHWSHNNEIVCTYPDGRGIAAGDFFVSGPMTFTAHFTDAPQERITLHAYGTGSFDIPAGDRWSCADGTYLVIPVSFGETLDLSVVERYLTSEEDAFAFWGWFTNRGLNDSGRTRGEHRRPTVGTFGFEGGFGPSVTAAGFTRALSFTETEWNALVANGTVVDGSIDLFAIWSLWGDVNDDDYVDIDDIDALRRHVFGLTPRNPINEAPGDVLRDGALDIDDIDVLRRNVFGLTPRLTMGQRPAGTASPASLLNARMDSVGGDAFAVATSMGITPLNGNIPAIWSISHETIAPDATYVNVRVRLDQIPTGGVPHGDGISSVMFTIQYDSPFLRNPSRAQILVLDRSLFSASQQMVYDLFVAQGWTEEDFIADPAFATAVVNTAENLAGYGFSYALWNQGDPTATGHDHGANIIMVEWSPSTDGSHDPTAHVYVSFRFDVDAGISAGDVAHVRLSTAPTPSPNPQHSGGIAGSVLPGSVRVEGFDIRYVANAQAGGTVAELPANQVGLAPGTHATRTGVPTHTNVDRNGTDTVVLFVGWSTTETDRIFALGERDDLPAGWIPAGGNVTITNAHIYLYAIWGWSTDGQGPPDVLRDGFDIHYNNNGGIGTMTSQTGLLPGSHPLSANTFTHAGLVEGEETIPVLFVGWSTTPIARVLEYNDTSYLAQLVTSATIVDSDVTVYAVWGVDRTGTGTPDVLGITVLVYSVSDTRLLHASLTREGAAVTRNENGTFTLEGLTIGDNVGDVLVASHNGFANNTHVIVAEDFEGTRTITIILGDEDGYEEGPRDCDYYEFVDLLVRVVNPAGALIAHAELIQSTIDALSYYGELLTNHADGTFTLRVDARNVTDSVGARATGFQDGSRAITYGYLAAAEMTITLLVEDPSAITVFVYSVSGARLLDASLTLEGETVARNENGTFTLNNMSIANVGNTLVASHAGFANNSHDIVVGDLSAPREITIILGDEDGYEEGPRDCDYYEFVYLVVRVVDVNDNLITHAELIAATIEALAYYGELYEDHEDGTFTLRVDARNVTDSVGARANGFNNGSNVITYVYLAIGTMDIELIALDPDAITVLVYSVSGERLTHASLTREGTAVAPNLDSDANPTGTFTLAGMDRNNVGNVLVASHPGFANNTHAIAYSDLESPRTITIILGDQERDTYDPYDPGDNDYYDYVTLTVEVRRGTVTGALVPNATLIVYDGQVYPAAVIAAGTYAGTFTLTVDARNRGDVLRANAVGLNHTDHTLTYVDLVNDVLVIVLTGDGVLIEAEYGDNGEVVVDVNLPEDEYYITVEDDRIVITIPDGDRDNITVGNLPGPGWDYTFDDEYEGDDIRVILIPPPGYFLVEDEDEYGNPILDDKGNPVIVIYHDVTFDAAAHGTFGVDANDDPITELTERVRRGTVLTADDEPTVILNSEGRPFLHWTADEDGYEVQTDPEGYVVERSVTFTAQYDSDIVVNAEYGEDGEVNVNVNLPPGDYNVNVGDNNTIVVTIPDEDYEDVSVYLPGPGWTHQPGEDSEGNLIITITPPPGYFLEEEEDEYGNPILDDKGNPVIVIYHDVTFDAGAHGTFGVDTNDDPITELTERVRRGTVIAANDIPEVILDSEGRPFLHWTAEDKYGYENAIDPEGYVVERSVTFTAQYTTSIVIDVEYCDDGEVDVTVNLPPGDYNVNVGGDNTIVVTIPDEDYEDVTVNLPGLGWTHQPGEDSEGNLIITITPPPGYYVVEEEDEHGNPILDENGNPNIVIYHTVRFLPGANGTFAAPAEEFTMTVRRGTVVTADDVPAATANAGFSRVGWSPSDPVNHRVLGSITFTATWSVVVTDPRPAPGRPDPPTPIEDEPVPLVFIQDRIWYVRGFPDGSFRAGNAITRAEISMILFRLLDSAYKNEPQSDRFDDVVAGRWYAQAINYLASRNILRGFPDGDFRPNAQITRAELTAVMSRFFEMQVDGNMNFSDVSESHWAFAYINNANSRGWVTGFPEGDFRPNNATSRAEAVTLINRVLERVPNPTAINYHLDDYLDGELLFDDLGRTHWAYYQIMEAAVERIYEVDEDGNETWMYIYIPGVTQPSRNTM